MNNVAMTQTLMEYASCYYRSFFNKIHKIAKKGTSG